MKGAMMLVKKIMTVVILLNLFLLLSHCDKDSMKPGVTPSFEVMPLKVRMCEGETVQLQAVFEDSTTSVVIWRIVSGQGTISTNGFFESPPDIPGDSLLTIIEASLSIDISVSKRIEIVIYSNDIITFENAYSFFGGFAETGYSVVETRDGDFVLTGGTEPVSNQSRFFILSANNRGEFNWIRDYGRGIGYSIIQTADGFVVAGEADTSALVIKTTNLGTPIWTTVLPQRGRAKFVVATSDGGYVLTGNLFLPPVSTGGMPPFIWIAKLDGNGQLLWSKTYQKGGGNSIIETHDQGLLLVGYTQTPFQTYLLKTNHNGDSLWSNSFDIGEQGVDLLETDEEDFVIFGRGFQGFYLLKTDEQGTPLWSHTYDGGENWFASSLEMTTDAGFIMSGWWLQNPGKDFDVYLAKADAEGNLQWSKSFGGNGEELAYAVQQTIDGGFLVVGRFVELPLGKIYLIKTDTNGVVRCRSDL